MTPHSEIPTPHSEEDPESLSGTLEDVRSFFRVKSRSTVYDWMSGAKPKLAHWHMGEIRMIPESAVLDLWCSGYVASRGMRPGEDRELGKREWRQHLCVRYTSGLTYIFPAALFTFLDRRVSDLEAEYERHLRGDTVLAHGHNKEAA